MNWIQYLFEIAMLKDKPKRRVRDRPLLKTEQQREKDRLRMREKRKQLKMEKHKKGAEGGIEDTK